VSLPFDNNRHFTTPRKIQLEAICARKEEKLKIERSLHAPNRCRLKKEQRRKPSLPPPFHNLYSL
jgi:hypothetical protein